MEEFDFCGFEELPHTSDWCLHVWATDFPGLVSAAFKGMQSLMGLVLQPGPPLTRRIRVEGMDAESLLVAALTELLFLNQIEGLGASACLPKVENGGLFLQLELRPIASLAKEVKAVTYHNLALRSTPRGLETTIVFDA